MIKYITFDCHDPQALALFWSAALGYEIVNWDNFDAALSQAADGHLPRLAFIKVPEGKTVKNRLHLNVEPSGTTDGGRCRAFSRAGCKSNRAIRRAVWNMDRDGRSRRK